jgi:hypothetical protein
MKGFGPSAFVCIEMLRPVSLVIGGLQSHRHESRSHHRRQPRDRTGYGREALAASFRQRSVPVIHFKAGFSGVNTPAGLSFQIQA